MNTRAEKLFNRAWGKKGEAHWVLCLASYMLNGSTAKMAQEHGCDPQTIRNHAKTYRLFRFLRWWAWFKPDGEYRLQVQQLQQLRHDIHYSKWFVVAQRLYHEDKSKRIDPQTALDFLKEGEGKSVRDFAGYISSNDLTRSKAFQSAASGLRKALTFPMPKKEKRILKKALAIAEKRK